MKKINISYSALLFVIVLAVNVLPQNRSIQFQETTWSQIIEKAKSENKLIFLDAFASWCGPCKYLAASVFTNDTVADFFNKNFVNAHFDMEKGEGVDIRAKYDVKVFPTLVFINKDGEVVHQAAGSRAPSEFLQLGMDALNPDKQLITYRKKFESGNRDSKFVMGYLELLRDSYSPYDKITSEYLKNQDENKLTDRGNWEIIRDYQSDINSREVKYLIKNKSAFAKLYTSDSVDMKIKASFGAEFAKVMRASKGSKTAIDSVKLIVKNSGYDKAEDVLLTADYTYYKGKKDAANFVPVADKLLKAKDVTAIQCNEAAWFVFENTKDKELLKKAAVWAKAGIQLQENSGIVDTYANILFAIGKKDEAIKNEEKALELAKKEGQGADEIQKTLDEMKK